LIKIIFFIVLMCWYLKYFFKIKNIILMHFQTNNILKNNHYHNPKHPRFKEQRYFGVIWNCVPKSVWRNLIFLLKKIFLLCFRIVLICWCQKWCFLKNILMHFQAKKTLKNKRYHTSKHPPWSDSESNDILALLEITFQMTFHKNLFIYLV
jgi:hypothetical protein